MPTRAMLNKIKELADSVGIKLSVRNRKVILTGRTDQADELVILVRQWKPEMIKVLNGGTVTDVG